MVVEILGFKQMSAIFFFFTKRKLSSTDGSLRSSKCCIKMYSQVKSYLYISSLKTPIGDEDNFQADQTEIYLPFASMPYYFPLLHMLIMESICAAT